MKYRMQLRYYRGWVDAQMCAIHDASETPSSLNQKLLDYNDR